MLRVLTYVGLLAPIVVGLVASTLGADDKSLPAVIKLAAIVGGAQVVLFLWSVVSNWVDRTTYSLESTSANQILSRRYSELAEAPPSDAGEFRSKLSLIDLEDGIRRQLDEQQGISDAELRMGMRASLRQFKQACAACEEVPVSLSPTACSVCGSFGIVGQVRSWKERRIDGS